MTDCRALYVHIPFCCAKCAYCDFNSYARQERLIPAYVDALLREAAFWSGANAVATVETLYLGGGTPSLLPIEEAALLLDGLRRLFVIAPDAEITTEANPESVDTDRLRALRRLGVNRLSLGIQSFDDGELRLLGRIHDAATAETAYRAARAAGFADVSLDLIFGLPGQTVAQWRRSLESALALEPDHLSLYALTLEDSTPLSRRVSAGKCPEPDADVQADMYAWSGDRLAAAGYEHYEISNWAQPNHRCRHNLVYWRAEPYLGLGAGAHSYLAGCRFAGERTPRRYIALVDRLAAAAPAGDPLTDPTRLPQVTTAERLDTATEMADAIIVGLRLTDGISPAVFQRRFGVDLSERYAREIEEVSGLGLLESADGRMRLTERGRLLGNDVFQRFLP